MPHFFVSHTASDKPVVRAFLDALPSSLDAYLDEEQIIPGDELTEVLGREIADAPCFLLFVSDQSLQSEWVGFEIEAAISNRCRIIPIVIGSLTYTKPEWLSGIVSLCLDPERPEQIRSAAGEAALAIAEWFAKHDLVSRTLSSLESTLAVSAGEGVHAQIIAKHAPGFLRARIRDVYIEEFSFSDPTMITPAWLKGCLRAATAVASSQFAECRDLYATPHGEVIMQQAAFVGYFTTYLRDHPLSRRQSTSLSGEVAAREFDTVMGSIRENPPTEDCIAANDVTQCIIHELCEKHIGMQYRHSVGWCAFAGHVYRLVEEDFLRCCEENKMLDDDA